MTTYYLDFEGGNDAADGTSFANRWKTVTSGATTARIAPGDTIRVMASPTETSMAQNGTWTDASSTITLASAVTANIDACESAWSASANVTCTTTTNCPEGTNAANNAIAGGFSTGLAAFKATGTIDLSTYQQVSFWFFANLAVAASTLSLRLCSDTAGVTTVDTIAIPAIAIANQWVPVTVNTGGALGSSIKSVALYCDLDPGTVTVVLDNILACKASSSADSLTLKSLIGKPHCLAWVASTTYATNDIRQPTEANRTGFAYKVTGGGGGAAGGSEPTWPAEIGLTVTDGALTWTCQQLEEYWYAILSINGTTVKVTRNLGASNPKGAVRGYAGTSETVAAYKRECIDVCLITATAQAVQDAGSDGSPIAFVGGYDRTNMSTRLTQTWLMGGSQRIYTSANMITTNDKAFVNLDGLNVVSYALKLSTRGQVKNCHMASARNGFAFGSNSDGQDFNNCGMVGGWGEVFGQAIGGSVFNANCITSNGVCLAATAGIQLWDTVSNSQFMAGRFSNVDSKNNPYGVLVAGNGAEVFFHNLTTTNSGTDGVSLGSLNKAIRCFKSTMDSVSVSQPGSTTAGVYSQDDGRVSGAHLITKGQGTIQSATDQRNTASGIAWKFQITSATYSYEYFPLELSVAKFAVNASALVTVTLYVRRDATNIKGRLRLKPGQIGGAAAGAYVDCNPSANTWTQYTLTFTPNEAGAVELTFQVWNTVNATEHVWIDDLAVSQA